MDPLDSSGSYMYGISQHLNRARQSIDRALLSMKLNATKNLSHELVAVPTSTQDIPLDKNQNRSGGTQSNRIMNGRTTSALVNGNLI